MAQSRRRKYSLLIIALALPFVSSAAPWWKFSQKPVVPFNIFGDASSEPATPQPQGRSSAPKKKSKVKNATGNVDTKAGAPEEGVESDGPAMAYKAEFGDWVFTFENGRKITFVLSGANAGVYDGEGVAAEQKPLLQGKVDEIPEQGSVRVSEATVSEHSNLDQKV